MKSKSRTGSVRLSQKNMPVALANTELGLESFVENACNDRRPRIQKRNRPESTTKGTSLEMNIASFNREKGFNREKVKPHADLSAVLHGSLELGAEPTLVKRGP